MRRGNSLADFLSRVAVLVIVVLAAVGVVGWYLPLIKQNQSLQKEIELQKSEVEALQDDIKLKRQQLDGYQNDPGSLERLARESLEFSNEGELVFVFESTLVEASPSSADAASRQ